MRHPRATRLELRFPRVASYTMVTWCIVNSVFAIALAVYILVSYTMLWPHFHWEEIKYFLGTSIVFWAMFLTLHPGGRLLVYEMVIDTAAGTITGSGVVFGKRVPINVPIAAVTEVKYYEGSENSSPKPSMIEIRCDRPHRNMELKNLAAYEPELNEWIKAML